MLVILSEEVHVSFADGRVISLGDFSVVEVVPLSVSLDIADIVSTVGACAQVGDEAVQVVEARSFVLVGRFIKYFSHFMITIRVIHVREQPLCCSVGVVILNN